MDNKYYCKICKYTTGRLFNFNKHKLTKKHISNATTFLVAKNATEVAKFATEVAKNATKKVADNVVCEYCNKSIFEKKFLKRHYKSCSKYKEYLIEHEKNNIINQLKYQLEQQLNILKKKDNDLKQNKETLKKKQEELEELRDTEKEYLEFMKKVANTNTNVTNINHVNMYYIIQHYIKAKNYEDVMNPPLTTDEKQYVHENGGVYGGHYILQKRCIDGLELNERPFHCVDDARNKYMIRTNNTWHIDKKGEQVLEGIYPKMLKICAPKEISNADELDEWRKYN